MSAKVARAQPKVGKLASAPSERSSAYAIARARPARQGAQVVEMQRRRLVAAATELVCERGAQGVTIALIAQRAGASRRTFYEAFADREECLLAVFEGSAQVAARAVEAALAGQRGWCNRVRAAVVGLLAFLDEERPAGRVLVVEALAFGERTLEARRRVLARASELVDLGRAEPGAEPALTALTAEAVVGAVLSLVHARVLARERRPLLELAPALTAIVAQPYLGRDAAARELRRRPRPPERATERRTAANPFTDLPIRLTYRTARVLASIAADPGCSGKRVALASGVPDEGQMSRLLRRLERAGLVENGGAGRVRGEANAWRLTARGREVHSVIALQGSGS